MVGNATTRPSGGCPFKGICPLHHVTLVRQIAEFEEELERLLAVQTEREQLDAEEYSLLLEQAGFPTHEVPSLSCLHFVPFP